MTAGFNAQHPLIVGFLQNPWTIQHKSQILVWNIRGDQLGIRRSTVRRIPVGATANSLLNHSLQHCNLTTNWQNKLQADDSSWDDSWRQRAGFIGCDYIAPNGLHHLVVGNDLPSMFCQEAQHLELIGP